jgi:hypothetical protein
MVSSSTLLAGVRGAAHECGLLGLGADDVPTGCPTEPRSGGLARRESGIGWALLGLALCGGPLISVFWFRLFSPFELF